MTPQAFIAKWGKPDGLAGPAYWLNEEQGAQSHFLDLCELLDIPKPGSAEGYLFEEKNTQIGGHMFERLVDDRHVTADRLTQGLRDPFAAQQRGRLFGTDEVPWFNHGLFRTIDVAQLRIRDVTALRNAAALGPDSEADLVAGPRNVLGIELNQYAAELALRSRSGAAIRRRT